MLSYNFIPVLCQPFDAIKFFIDKDGIVNIIWLPVYSAQRPGFNRFISQFWEYSGLVTSKYGVSTTIEITSSKLSFSWLNYSNI